MNKTPHRRKASSLFPLLAGAVALMAFPQQCAAGAMEQFTRIGLMAGGIFLLAFLMAALIYGLNEALRSKHKHRHHHVIDARPAVPARRFRRWIIFGIWILAWVLVAVALWWWARKH
jgi:amino acid transporter